MKKILILLISILLFPTSYASSDLRDYFILDKWHDIGQVKPSTSWYYTPIVPYTSDIKVKQLMQDNYDYVWDFYSSHNFPKSFIDWENNDSQFYVRWETPVVFKDVDRIRKVTENLYYSYRKDWEIEWQKGASMPERFITWYNSPDNKVIILYPIKDKITWYTEAFVQYPCGNLVYKDTNCSSLKPDNKNYSCDIQVEKDVIYDNENIEIKLSSNYPELKLESLYVNWAKNIKKISKDTYTLKKPIEWEYSLSISAINPITKKEFICDKIDIKVKKSPFCWDGIVDKWEQCDDWNFLSWDWCNQCKFETPTCSIIPKFSCVDNWAKLENIFTVTKNNWVLDNITTDNRTVDKNYRFYTPGRQTVSLTYINLLNPYVNNVCKAEIKVRSKAFCWDWIVNNWEICDPNDSKTWAMCKNTCEARAPEKCDINISGDLIKNKSIFVWIDKDYYSKINSVRIWDKELIINDGDYSSFRQAQAWTYKVYVELVNKIDSSVSKTCYKEVKILEQDLCR